MHPSSSLIGPVQALTPRFENLVIASPILRLSVGSQDSGPKAYKRLCGGLYPIGTRARSSRRSQTGKAARDLQT